MSDSQRQGAKAEQHVKEILIRHGWRLLDQNWRCRYGEIDLLLTKKHSMNNRVLVVEVKARRYAGIDGWGAAAFHHTKRRCLARTVACWQADNPWSETSDFEVLLALVALPLPSRQVRWIRIESLNGAR